MRHKRYLNMDSLELYRSIRFSQVCSVTTDCMRCANDDCQKLRLLCSIYLDTPVISAPFTRLKEAIQLELESEIITTIMDNNFTQIELESYLTDQWDWLHLRHAVPRLLNQGLVKELIRGRGKLRVLKSNVRKARKLENQPLPAGFEKRKQ